jgi:hypothetical protein
MPFNLYIVTSSRTHGYLNNPDGQRADIEQTVADYRNGTKSLDQTLTFAHRDGDVVLRYADISDMWIEDAS